MAALHDVETQRCDIAAKRGAVQEKVLLLPPAERVQCEPGTVLVEAEMVRLGQRAFAGRPITILTAPGTDCAVDGGATLASLTLSGPQPALAALQADGIPVVLDVRDLGLGNHAGVRLSPRLPTWATLDRLDPETVDVTIRRGRRH
jgi:hypothetical protein